MRETDRARALRLVPEMAAIEDELVVYANLLSRWQGKINLIGRATQDTVWTRHFADSLQLAQLAPMDRKWADLGSGAGFPGLILALAQKKYGAGEMHLIESDARKAAFLREVSRETGAAANIWNLRCEDALFDIEPEIIVSRAMADLQTLGRITSPFVEKGAIALFPKGRDVEVELTRLSISSRFLIDFSESKIDETGRIVRMRAI